MKEKIVKLFPFILKISRGKKIKKKLKSEYKIFNENWMYSDVTKEKVGYEIILEAHALEKGMTSVNPRFFGVSKTKIIIGDLIKYEENKWDKDFAYNFGLCILIEYCKFYENNKWQNREEYCYCYDFVKDKESNVSSGTQKIKKSEIIKHSNIDYDDFLSSRHSFREYENKKISKNDMEKAVNMAIKTPTACNRQMCKIYYIESSDIKQKIVKFSHGLTNFNLETVNLIVVTYDISSLCNPGEIMQGMFNSGLVSMNLVNALHSLGIGSCFLEYNDTEQEENEMKKIVGIPKNEKISIVIAAGYYPEESIITCSARKPLNEIYRVI